MKEALHQLFTEFQNSIQKNDFVKLTLSKPIRKSDELSNVYIRQIMLKGDICCQF